MKTFILVLLIALSYSSGVIGQIKSYSPKYDSCVIEHKYYELKYSELHEQALWVAYVLKDSYLEKNTDRKDDFREDPAIITGSASLNDYKGSGYDRGHLMPAADMVFDEVAMSESFYMSNMSPQLPGFNRGVWKRLENQVRRWVIDYEELYIISGGVLNNIIDTIGPNRVSVPGSYYKIILDTEPEYRAVAFLIPHRKSSLTLDSFIVSIDSVEKVTGIDFLPALPDSIDNKIELEANLFFDI